MADAPVVEMKSAAELNTQNPPPFVASTEGLPPPMDDNAVRAIFAQAAAQGIDDLSSVAPTPAPIGQPEPAPAPAPAPVEVPQKFQKPDGTVDEEKLKASSTQLDQAIAAKEKTIEEVLAEYKQKENKFREVSERAKQVKAESPVVPTPVPGQPDPNVEQLRQQLLALQAQDPIAFAVEIARAVARKEAGEIAKPALEAANLVAEEIRDKGLRAAVTNLAQDDPRVLQHWDAVSKELDSDPGYFRLKNPHKAAWNEVKGRLRLGDAPPRMAQPSNPSPILGRGTPAPVSGLPNPQNPGTVYQQVQQVDPYSQEGKALEDQIRAMTNKLWQ